MKNFFCVSISLSSGVNMTVKSDKDCLLKVGLIVSSTLKVYASRKEVRFKKKKKKNSPAVLTKLLSHIAEGCSSYIS